MDIYQLYINTFYTAKFMIYDSILWFKNGWVLIIDTREKNKVNKLR
jgi:hypothetical protein